MFTYQLTIHIDFLTVILWLFIGCIAPIFLKSLELEKIIHSRTYYRYSQKFEITLADFYTLLIAALAGPFTIIYLILAAIHDSLHDLGFIIFQKSIETKREKNDEY